MVRPSRFFSSLAPFAVIGALALTVPAHAQQQPAGEIPITAQLTVRISELESQIRQLTGQIEDLSATVSQLRQRADRQASDVEFRLSELEKAREAATPPSPAGTTPAQTPPPAPGAPPRDLGTVAASQSPNAPVTLTPPGQQPQTAARPAAGAVTPPAASPATPPAKAGSPKEAYEQAFALIQKQDYPAAEQSLRSFIATYPNDELAGNAQHWLAQTYYVRGNYQEAATLFFQGYQKYPKNNKAPDNLMKLGMALANLNKVKEACASFNRFNTEYPTASAFLKRRVQEERARNNCGA